VNPEEDDLVRRLREATGRPPATLDLRPAEQVMFDPDLVPDITPDAERSDEDLEIDGILDRVDILDAYQKWCGKMVPKVGSKRESIMISCPNPQHPDREPSAWINLDTQVWFCGGCQIGGDKYDIAAWYHGYDVPGYKGKDFPALRRDMAGDLGYVVRRTPGGQEYVEPVEPSPEASLALPEPSEAPGAPSSEPDNQETPSNVIDFPANPIETESFEHGLDRAGIRIDWEAIVPPDTFLWEWMEATTIDDLPPEYYFWLGMQALGFAVGDDVLMDDYRRIKANLFVCLYGPTGTGKSRSIEPFAQLIREALPWDGDDYTPSKGVQLLASPASAEALLRMFAHDIKDPSTQQITKRAQVRGMLRVEEFASFVARASRPTNPMKETLIELFDVLDHTIKHTSVTGGTVQAHNPFAQMITSTQPKAIHSFLRRTDTESGFLNRWVFAAGTRRRQRISYGGVQIDTSNAQQHLRGIHAWSGQKHLYTLDGAALKVWDEFFHREIVPLHDGNVESMLSRIDLILKKLIILFAINSKESQPSVESVERAIALYPYLRMTSVMFSKDIAHSEFEECRVRLLEVIAATKDGVTMRVLAQKTNGKFDRQLIVQVMKTMMELGEIKEEVNKTQRGPATARYRAVD
jgi:energy-coupling factor transporter ATP-binding protein EcfA2